MASKSHTFGPTCRLQTGSNPFNRRASEISDLPPKIHAQFFYNAPLTIDDPLSPLPPLTSVSSAVSSLPRPFSSYDNDALEEAWLGVHRRRKNRGYGSFSSPNDAGRKRGTDRGSAPVFLDSDAPFGVTDTIGQHGYGTCCSSTRPATIQEAEMQSKLSSRNSASTIGAPAIPTQADNDERTALLRLDEMTGKVHSFAPRCSHKMHSYGSKCSDRLPIDGKGLATTQEGGVSFPGGMPALPKSGDETGLRGQHSANSSLAVLQHSLPDQKTSDLDKDTDGRPIPRPPREGSRVEQLKKIIGDTAAGQKPAQDDSIATLTATSLADLPPTVLPKAASPPEYPVESSDAPSSSSTKVNLSENPPDLPPFSATPPARVERASGIDKGAKVDSAIPQHLKPVVKLDPKIVQELPQTDGAGEATGIYPTQLTGSLVAESPCHCDRHASGRGIIVDNANTPKEKGGNLVIEGSDGVTDTSLSSTEESQSLVSGGIPVDPNDIAPHHSCRHNKEGNIQAKLLEKEAKREAKALKRAAKAQSGSPANITDLVGITQYGSSPTDRDTTGTPFLRAPARNTARPPLDDSTAPDDLGVGNPAMPNDFPVRIAPNTQQHPSSIMYPTPNPSDFIEPSQTEAFVPVGLSRLHLVEMPELMMKPIYWSPVHAISSVTRGTWFYKNTMMPVEADVANQLEQGYMDIRPWSLTYEDEVTSCLEIGPEAETKLLHKLWPTPEQSNLADQDTESLPSDGYADQAKAFEAVWLARHGHIENLAAGLIDLDLDEKHSRLYAKSSIMFANARDAQILKPSLLPSVARGRRPLGSIRKGRTIGVPVLRGFDQKAYDRLYPSKKGATFKKAELAATISQSGAAATILEREVCEACQDEETRPRATDLVLVIHGIGQKLSERVESFHFTHSINAFRRELSLELTSDEVRPWIREDSGGIMVLPVNWRTTLKLDDADPTTQHQRDDLGRKEFGLKDITPDTIPAVRNLISDVMLDIPYYLSHHKPKMVEAVIKEANRIYRLWCRNNPGFDQTGRVHLIAHSLGSVMALDILSNQPTTIPASINLNSTDVHTDIFEFDTKNLFFCGSPAGFFLLLNHASLIPRRGRNKAGMEGEDDHPKVSGQAGTFGCLAVDNVYNIMHRNDPISYRLNPCVDVDHASALLPAAVPSTASSWLDSLGHVFRSKPAALARPLPNFGAAPSATMATKPSRPALAHLTSAVEMDTRNFSHEELAERRMTLLNENGQIDYFLHSGSGPLEFQYLNMLSAHSSYWLLQDFVRLLVVEIGRRGGRAETVPAMRAVKKAWGKK